MNKQESDQWTKIKFAIDKFAGELHRQVQESGIFESTFWVFGPDDRFEQIPFKDVRDVSKSYDHSFTLLQQYARDIEADAAAYATVLRGFVIQADTPLPEEAIEEAELKIQELYDEYIRDHGEVDWGSGYILILATHKYGEYYGRCFAYEEKHKNRFIVGDIEMIFNEGVLESSKRIVGWKEDPDRE